MKSLNLKKMAVLPTGRGHLDEMLRGGNYFNLQYVRVMEDAKLFHKVLFIKKAKTELTHVKIDVIDLNKSRYVSLLFTSDKSMNELYNEQLYELFNKYYRVEKDAESLYFIKYEIIGRIDVGRTKNESVPKQMLSREESTLRAL